MKTVSRTNSLKEDNTTVKLLECVCQLFCTFCAVHEVARLNGVNTENTNNIIFKYKNKYKQSNF